MENTSSKQYIFFKLANNEKAVKANLYRSQFDPYLLHYLSSLETAQCVETVSVPCNQIERVVKTQ